jgi:NAD-dependent deacetylase
MRPRHNSTSRSRKLLRLSKQRRRLRVFYSERIRECQMKKPYVVILTGAGISAESGIKTFRAADGLWEEHRVEDVATPEGYQRNPQRVQAFYNERRRQLQQPSIKPNAAHESLAALEQYLGDHLLLVTQNIDNLHEKAGSQNIIHMHGELLKVRCVYSDKVFDWKGDLTEETRCECCHKEHALRPHIVWFGEMPFEMEKIYHAIENADYFIAIGTSGNVYPAAGFVEYAKAQGVYTIELNLEPSKVENLFDECRYGLASEIVPQYVYENLQQCKERQRECYNCP